LADAASMTDAALSTSSRAASMEIRACAIRSSVELCALRVEPKGVREGLLARATRSSRAFSA
jgi:hypothetical protein